MTVWIILAAVLCVAVILINETMLFFSQSEGCWTDFPDQAYTAQHNKRAVLMLHEYLSRPESLQYLGTVLHQQGWDVYIPAMPGGAGSTEELKMKPAALYQHWYARASQELDRLSEQYRYIALVGSSLGGTICLDLAAREKSGQICSLVCVSSPVTLVGRHYRRLLLRNSMVLLSGILGLFRRAWVFRALSAQARQQEPFYGPEGILLSHSIHSHRLGMRRLRKNLHRVGQDLLLIHSPQDRTVGYASQGIIADRVSSAFVRCLSPEWNEDGTRHHHLCNHTYTREWVTEQISAFLNRHSYSEAPAVQNREKS